MRGKERAGPRPTARNVCKGPGFSTYIASISESIDLVQQPAGEMLRLYNKVVLTSAKRVRDGSIFENPDGSENKRLVADSISRAIWRQYVTLAKCFCSRSMFAASI